MNKLFWQSLKRDTDCTFELIVIDNCSTDGSREFFRSLINSGENIVLIENEGNYSYPHCQNQGITAAKGEILVFLNNDLFVSPNWATRMLEVIGNDGYDIVSFASNDRIGNLSDTKKLSRRWKRIKYPILTIFGQGTFALKLMVKLCYGDYAKFSERIFNKYGLSMTQGFSGSAIAMTRVGLEKIKEWDNSQYVADFDMYYTCVNRYEKYGDLKPLSTINGIFFHHYRRLTMRQAYPTYMDIEKHSNLITKWGQDNIDRWKKKLTHF